MREQIRKMLLEGKTKEEIIKIISDDIFSFPYEALWAEPQDVEKGEFSQEASTLGMTAKVGWPGRIQTTFPDGQVVTFKKGNHFMHGDELGGYYYYSEATEKPYKITVWND